jgi:hypothetical protein
MAKSKGDGLKEKFKFKREKSHTFTILDDQKKEVGTVCVRPDSVGWKPGGTQWYRLSLADFRNLVIQQGTKGEEI